MFKKAVLALAVVGAASSSFAAVEDDPFFKDATMDLGFRTYYFWGDEDYKDEKLNKDTNKLENQDAKHDAFAQGIRMDYKSGYFYDLVGLDLGVYTAIGLRTHDDEKASWGMLGNGNENKDLIKYGATVKVKLGGYGDLKYGTRQLNSHLYSDSDSRLTPELTQAASAEVAFGDLNAYAHQIIRGSYRSTEDLVDFDEKVYLVGGNYTFNNALNLSAAYGEQKDRNRQYWGQVDYPFSVAEGTITVSGNYQHINAIGSAQSEQGDDTASLWSARISLDYGPLLAEVAYGKADEYEIADLAWEGGNENGGSNLLTDNTYYVTLDSSDMQSYYAALTYDFTKMVPGLSFDLGYMQGKNDTMNSKEYYARVNYDVQSVKNLWVGATYVTGDDEDKVGAGTVDWKHLRLQLRYDFSV